MKVVLSCDGGGVRGLATCQFLKRLEESLHKDLFFVFDMFAGTSIGSITAASLGCNQNNISQALTVYEEPNINSIFNATTMEKLVGLISTKPKYDGTGKTAFLEQFFQDRILQDSEKPVIITAFDLGARRFKLFGCAGDQKCRVVDACNASSAAPAYFPAIKVNSDWFIDGGVVANNPSMAAYAEARAMWPDEEICILSVGTGSRRSSIDGEAAQNWGGPEWVAGGLLEIVMDESMVDFQAETLLKSNYVRVNSDLREAKEPLDDTSTENIRALTDLGDYWWEVHGQKTIEMLKRAGKV